MSLTDEATFVLKVKIIDGRGFGPDIQALCCTAVFANDSRPSTYSVGRDLHVWNADLSWSITKQQLSRLTSMGSNSCKCNVHLQDGTKIGYFVLNMRQAKLQHQYKKEEGELIREGRDLSFKSSSDLHTADIPTLC